MPTAVSSVRWKCKQCQKSYWLKPSVARAKVFCSRKCYYASLPVPNPVRAKRANVVVRYGWRNCEQCDARYEAKTKQQKFCSQECQTNNIHDRRRLVSPDPKECEHCGKVFVPRRRSAGRFCSWGCKIDGQKSEKAGSWRGGRHIDSSGYVLVSRPGHPRAHGHGSYVLEHILVMEEKLGRPVEKYETVHHIDGNRQNNDIRDYPLTTW